MSGVPPLPGGVGELEGDESVEPIRDPFADLGTDDPLERRLDALEPRPVPRGPVPAGPQRARPHRPQRARREAPALSEIEVGEPRDLIDRLLPEPLRRALAGVSQPLDGRPYDPFGFSPEATRRALPWFHALYRYYFRVESRGHEHLPERGAAVLAANHAGLLPFDAAMSGIDVLLHTDPPRVLRSIVDLWAGSLPYVNVFFARVGQVIGTRENFSELLDDEQLVLVFPEGIAGIRKNVTQRYRLQTFRVGFIEQALRARAPIVPTAIIGSDDQAPILYDWKGLARALGLPVAPITPTFPWLGPLGLLPYPVRYRIVYGEPLNFHERFGPDGAEDARLVHYLAKQVRREVQRLIDRNRA